MSVKKRLCSLVTAIAVAATSLLSSVAPVMAADVANATIDPTKTGSMTIFKYDFTNASKDGVWDDSYVSTGRYDDFVNQTLGQTKPTGDSDNVSNLGNGHNSYGYAIKGVEFTYLRVADIYQFTESADDQRTDSHVELLYGFKWDNASQNILSAIGLDANNRYQNADAKVDGVDIYYYQSDVLVNALSAALTTNATDVKDALEQHIINAGGTAMNLTNEHGMTAVSGLPLGLYLVVETKVPEHVTTTINPFFVSLPMTSVDGTEGNMNGSTPNGLGGSAWMYDITLYPKNNTGIPTLEKTLRENETDTGKHNGTTNDITDGYTHNATASAGDVIDYQIISTLPTITSASTYLTEYSFLDKLSVGITYNKDVKIEFFKDKECKNLITTWTLADATAKFSTTYNTADNTMKIAMTAAGLAELNTIETVYPAASVFAGYSDCTIRITYTATMNSDNTVVFGDNGNPNNVVLTWRRSSSEYYDTLVDDCHLYTYGIDLTKQFSDNNGDFSKVEFAIYNETDGYYVQAVLNTTEGIYYVVDNAAVADHACTEEEATHFIPTVDGKIIVKGLEDDHYILTELRTDNGYTLLRENIDVVISQQETMTSCDIYTSDMLGLVQNDARYDGQILDSQQNDNFMQPDLEHKHLTASATVDSNAVTMLVDRGSANAEAPLTVVNTHGFTLPATGSTAQMMLVIGGVSTVCAAMFMMLFVFKKQREEEEDAQ